MTSQSQISQLRKLIREQLLLLTESVCPRCGDPNAYIGFHNNVECPNKACPKFSQQQFDDIHRGPATRQKAGDEWWRSAKYYDPKPDEQNEDDRDEHYDHTNEDEIIELLMLAQTYELDDENDLDMLRDLGYVESNSRELTQMGRDVIDHHLIGLDPFESF